MAVRLGITAARGDVILFTDADLSVRIECLEELVTMMVQRPDLDGILGSRRLRESRIIIRQPPLRSLSGKAFNMALRAIGLTRFADRSAVANSSAMMRPRRFSRSRNWTASPSPWRFCTSQRSSATGWKRCP